MPRLIDLRLRSDLRTAQGAQCAAPAPPARPPPNARRPGTAGFKFEMEEFQLFLESFQVNFQSQPDGVFLLMNTPTPLCFLGWLGKDDSLTKWVSG